MLRISDLSVQVGQFSIDGISLEVEEGDYFVLLGASGAGKSVLLETIAGQHTPRTGAIELGGRDITGERVQKRQVALVYQDQNLFPHMSVARNIGYGLRSRGAGRTETRQKVEDIAGQVGAFHLLERRPRTLSGGEAQRVALARALITEPRCLMLDEPLASLDAAPSDEIQRLLRDLNRTQGCTVLHVTHDFEEALSMGSHVAIMEGGTIRREGSPEEVFRRPQSEFEARMAGIRNFFRGRLWRTNEREAEFRTNGLRFVVLTDAPPTEGYLIVRSTEVTLSEDRTHTSARNCIEGTVVDVAGAQGGLEVTVDINGFDITALITHRSAERLGLGPGAATWASFKASAARFVPAE